MIKIEQDQLTTSERGFLTERIPGWFMPALFDFAGIRAARKELEDGVCEVLELPAKRVWASELKRSCWTSNVLIDAGDGQFLYVVSFDRFDPGSEAPTEELIIRRSPKTKWILSAKLTGAAVPITQLNDLADCVKSKYECEILAKEDLPTEIQSTLAT